MEENKKIAVKVSGVKKMYKLGQIGGGTLQADLQSWWAKVRGKEDPNSKIGEDQRSNGKTFMALNGVDLTIYQGEAVGIIGSNGAGKSTLLKLLSRVTAPTEGTIDINGRIASMLEVGTGFNPEMTGRENVYLNGAILGMTKAEIYCKMEDIIEFSEVREFIDTPVKRYSSGMFVKLAFSVAAHLDSEIMIMDEVLAVGDMTFQKKCLTKMREAAKQDGRTVLYVSHNMNTIRQLCDRCIVLDKGKVVFEGDVEEAISVYMGDYLVDSYNMDLSGIKRLDFIKRDDVRLVFAEYLDKKNIIFEKGEPLLLRLRWRNNRKIENIGFRFVVYTGDGTHLCAAFKYNFYSGAPNCMVEADLKVDVSNLAPGRYQSNYVFFYVNEYGGTEDVDQLRGLDFIIDDSTIMGKLPWRTDAWGHLELPEPKIVQFKEV